MYLVALGIIALEDVEHAANVVLLVLVAAQCGHVALANHQFLVIHLEEYVAAPTSSYPRTLLEQSPQDLPRRYRVLPGGRYRQR